MKDLISSKGLQLHRLARDAQDGSILDEGGDVSVVGEGDEEIIDMLVPDEHDEGLSGEGRDRPHRLDPCLFSVVDLHEVEGLVVLGQSETRKLPLFPDHQGALTGALDEASHLHDRFLGRIDLGVLEALDTIGDGQHRVAATDSVDVTLDHLQSCRVTLGNAEDIASEDVIVILVHHHRLLLVDLHHRLRILLANGCMGHLFRDPHHEHRQYHQQTGHVKSGGNSTFHLERSFQRACPLSDSAPVQFSVIAPQYREGATIRNLRPLKDTLPSPPGQNDPDVRFWTVSGPLEAGTGVPGSSTPIRWAYPSLRSHDRTVCSGTNSPM